MKPSISSAFLASTLVVGGFSAGAAAQTADFRCPAAGTAFTYKSGDSSSVHVASGQEGNACLIESMSGGKTETVRLHWGLIGSVDAAGESYAGGLDLKTLWPLKIGNRIQQTVKATGRDGKPYSSDVTVTVAAYEKITVPAGTFDTFRVEESKAGEPVLRTRWWAPSLGTSAKESFPDWTDRSKLKVYDLVAVKPAKP